MDFDPDSEANEPSGWIVLSLLAVSLALSPQYDGARAFP